MHPIPGKLYKIKDKSQFYLVLSNAVIIAANKNDVVYEHLRDNPILNSVFLYIKDYYINGSGPCNGYYIYTFSHKNMLCKAVSAFINDIEELK